MEGERASEFESSARASCAGGSWSACASSDEEALATSSASRVATSSSTGASFLARACGSESG